MINLIFIPTYNCEKQIIRVLNQLTSEISTYFKEIFIFDIRSTDRAVEVAQAMIKERSLPVEIRINHENVNLVGTHKLAFSYAIDVEFGQKSNVRLIFQSKKLLKVVSRAEV